jgi:hypothetical protein
MKKIRLAVVFVLVMIALAVGTFVATSRVEARGGGCKATCPSPPEGCDFLGCDASGNCQYQCF